VAQQRVEVGAALAQRIGRLGGGGRPEVGAQGVAGDAGGGLDLGDALGGDTLLFPQEDGAARDVQRRLEGFHASSGRDRGVQPACLRSPVH
jgi:hypothetical protein